MKPFLTLLAAAMTAGCGTTPNWDRQFGTAVHTAIASQTLNPNAAANRDPVTGVDTAAAVGAQKRYEQSFAQPASQANITLLNNIGK